MEESLNNKNEARSELLNLTIRDVFYKYVRFLPVFILSVALALFGAYAYLRYTTPIYSTGKANPISLMKFSEVVKVLIFKVRWKC